MNLETESERFISIFLCGDVMTGRGIDQLLPRPSAPHIFEPYLKDARGYLQLAEALHGPIRRPVPFGYIWGDAVEVLQRMAPDLRIVNLETSITTSEEYWPDKGINYRMHPANIDCLTAGGIDACALANNHVIDWGYQGLEETLRVLEEAGIEAAGAGRDEAQAAAPALLQLGRKGRVLLFSIGFPSSGIPWEWRATRDRGGVNLLPDVSAREVARIAEQVGAVKRGRDVVIASLHWDANWGFDIEPAEREFAHRLIDEAGVDLVHGHSSHHVKGIEVHHGKLILYGCGDFINDYEGIRGYASFRGDLGLMYFVTVDPESGALVSLEMVPTTLRKLRVHLASHADVHWMIDTLNREGRRLGTRVRLTERGTLLLHWNME